MFISPYLTQEASKMRMRIMRERIAKEAIDGMWSQDSDYFKLPIKERIAINLVLVESFSPSPHESYQHPNLYEEQI
jgi:hypothetical protein